MRVKLRLVLGSSCAAALTILAVPVLSQAPLSGSRQSLLDDLVVANHILANEGVLDGYGHVSVRSPTNSDRYFLSRAGAPALVTAAEITEYDLESRPVTNAAAAGYVERFIHGEIYKARPDVMAVVHCHCLDVIPFAAASVPLRPMYHMAYFIAEGVPVFDIRRTAGITDMLIGTPELGRALAQTLGGASAALMRGHGAVVAAASVRLGVAKAYYLNVNARLQMQAMAIGGDHVTYLDPEEAKKAVQTYERSWDHWRSRLPNR